MLKIVGPGQFEGTVGLEVDKEFFYLSLASPKKLASFLQKASVNGALDKLGSQHTVQQGAVSQIYTTK